MITNLPTTQPNGTPPLGFQPLGRSFGGQGNSLAGMLMSLMNKGSATKLSAGTQPSGMPTANQLTAFNGGAGPVSSSYANTLMQSAPARPDYYQIGFTGQGLY